LTTFDNICCCSWLSFVVDLSQMIFMPTVMSTGVGLDRAHAGGWSAGTIEPMEQRGDTNFGEQTRALLAEHGIHVTEEGVRRARAKLREADERVTPAEWRRLRDFIDAASL
jgi:hypothetical protein